MKALWWALAVFLLAAVMSELAARSILEKGVVAAVRARDPGAENVSSDVSSPVLYSLAANRSISRVRVSARHVDLGSLVADRVSATAAGVHMNVGSSIIDQKAEVTHIDRIDLTASFTQQEASAVLPHGWSFVFGQGTATLKGPFLSITGRVGLQPPSKVVFVLNSSLPPPFSSRLSLTLPLPALVSCVRSVALTPGALRVTCVQDNPSTDFLPRP